VSTVIDLHLHSSASDGSERPAELAERLAGASVVALTDHDTTAGVAELAEHLDGSVELVVGAELSLATDHGTFHLLCYGAGLLEEPARSLLATLAGDRRVRNETMLARAAELGLELTEAELLEAAGATSLDDKSVGRPHAAAVLVAKGYATSIADAFARYLAKGCPLYVPKARHRYEDVVGLLELAHVVTVVAHPLSLELAPADLEAELVRLRELGLVGIEAHYAAYTPDTRAELAALARRLSLVATGGSDAHGTFKPGLAPLVGYGDLVVDDAVAEDLLEVLARRGGRASLY
jgi:predicted metal-dependent phosphoesterase TrpH